MVARKVLPPGTWLGGHTPHAGPFRKLPGAHPETAHFSAPATYLTRNPQEPTQ